MNAQRVARVSCEVCEDYQLVDLNGVLADCPACAPESDATCQTCREERLVDMGGRVVPCPDCVGTIGELAEDFAMGRGDD